MDRVLMQHMKKIIAYVLMLVIVCGFIPRAYAEEKIEADHGLAEAMSEDGGISNAPVADGSTTSIITDEEIADVMAVLDDEESAGISTFSMGTMTRVEARGLDAMKSYSGATRYETAALQSADGWTSSRYAIVAGGEGWPDALAATSLAGALDCPLLLTDPTELSTATKTELSRLGVDYVLVVGGEPSVASEVVNDLGALGIQVKRLAGATRYETQLAIYEYGLSGDASFGIRGDLWAHDTVVVASGVSFADALSFSPVAYDQAIPVFLTDETGSLSELQKTTLMKGAQSDHLFAKSILLGDEVRVSEETEGFLWLISQLSSGASKASERLGGDTRYETSAYIAQWAVTNFDFSWNNAAFATGDKPYDALGGGAFQGSDRSVLLLVSDSAENIPVLNALLSSGASVDSIRLFGDEHSVTQPVRTTIAAKLGFFPVEYTDYAITLDRLVDLEWATNPPNVTYNQLYDAIDPDAVLATASGMYQFARLDGGYSGAVTAAQIDAYLAKNVVYQEANYRVTSKLRGTGAYFIEAAKMYDVNEVYLLAHAILESAWGCSTLAQGKVAGYEGYLNFYGIGAYDLDPYNGGAALAKQQGWTSPEKAIKGAASWIRSNYVVPTVSSATGSGAQNTLYKMKWDVKRAASSEAKVWHQYATGITWPSSIARLMSEFYSYSGVPLGSTGLAFDIPRYR